MVAVKENVHGLRLKVSLVVSRRESPTWHAYGCDFDLEGVSVHANFTRYNVKLTSDWWTQSLSISNAPGWTRIHVVLLCGWGIINADLRRAHLICRAQIAGTGGLVTIRREGILTITREHFRSLVVGLEELSTHRWYHAKIVIRCESRQFTLLRHEPR